MNLLELQHDPAAFRDALLIDTDAGPKPFAEMMDDFQRQDFEALDAGWKRAVIGADQPADYQRGWLERPRGHSKSNDIAVMAAWALFASRRRLSGIAAAGDQDQARILRDAIGKLTYVNPWLGKLLEVQAYRIINPRTESTMEIITSDAPTSYGLTPDFVIADEIVHWRKRDLWDSLLSSTAKRSTCMLVVITNAGFTDDWQHETREKIRTDNRWYFSRLDGAQATWILASFLDEQQKLLPPTAYRRLWENEWSSGGGDALTAADIDAAFFDDLQPQSFAQPGYEYVGGLDLGVSRDASAVCILGIRRGRHDHGAIRLAYTRVWRPTKGQKVDLQQIEDALIVLDDKFDLQCLNYDPWEARHMASRLQSLGLGRMVRPSDRRGGLRMQEITPSGKNLQAIATAVIEAFADRRFELYDDPDLERDLRKLRVEERQYGFRLVSPRDSTGHGDLGTAFSLATLAATDLASKRKIQIGMVPLNGAMDGPTTALAEFTRRQREYAAAQAEALESLENENQIAMLHAMADTFGPSFLHRM